MKRFIGILLVLLIGIGLPACSNPEKEAYKEAAAAIEAQDYARALELLAEIPEYKDSAALYDSTLLMYNYQTAVAAMEAGDYQAAIDLLEALGEYMDAPALLESAKQENQFFLIVKAIAKAIANDSGFLPEEYELYQCGYSTASNGDPYAMVFGAQLTVYLSVTYDIGEEGKIGVGHFIILVDHYGDARLMKNSGDLGLGSNSFDTPMDIARLSEMLPPLIATEQQLKTP